MKLMPPRASHPAKPKHAIAISLAVLIGGIPAAVLAHLFLDEPLGTAFLWYALAAYLACAVSWSFLDWKTRNYAIRGNNAFVVFVICLLIFLVATQPEHAPFPRWAVVLVIVAGIAGYSVAGVCGIKNFLRWRRGEFTDTPSATPPIE